MKGTSVRQYTSKELLNKVKSLNSFKSIPAGRWIIGVRSTEDVEDTFDDKFYEFEGETFIRVMSGTTNAGASVLKGGFKKMNKYGCAVLKADEWYYDVWQYGLHNGKMPALRQVGSQVLVYRDGNMNGKAEQIGSPIAGWYGINYHTNTYDFSENSKKIVKMLIGGWSAGCQVINDRIQYFEQMDWYRMAFKDGSQKFVTYCLLNEF